MTNKKNTAIILLITAILSLNLIPNAPASEISPDSINCYGTIQNISYLAKNSSYSLKNAIIFYGTTHLTQDQVDFVADHFSLLICDLNVDSVTLQAIKTKNPQILILGYFDVMGIVPSNSYWATVDQNENWFLHDSEGNRITNTQYGWRLMDVSSLGWRQFWVSYANTQLNGSLFDGVFADDVWPSLFTEAFSNSSPIPVAAVNGWHSSMVDFLQYTKANLLEGKQLVVNTGEFGTGDYLSKADGKMDEGLVHASWWDLTDFENTWFNPLDKINAMARDSASGKIFISTNGADIEHSLKATSSEINQNVMYCYAATLLAIDGPQCYFSYNSWYSADGSQGYYPIMSVDIGSPLGSYYQNQNIYMRDFSDGKVLFNPSSNTHSISLGQKYHLPDGTEVSSLVLGPWSGQVLQT